MRTSRIAQDTSRIVAASRAQRTASRTRSSANAVARPPSEEHDIYAPWESELVSDSADLRAGDKERATKRRKTGQGAPMAVKHEVGEISMAAIASPGKGSRPKKARSAPAKKTTVTKVGVQVEPPPHWETMYALTREMRKANLAPVDTMGCESLADKERTPRDQRFQTLIALMLSSQTKDTVTAVAMRGMQERMPGGFNLESVLALSPPTLNSFINKVGFHNLKTKYIKQTAELLRDKWNSEIPDSVEGLVSLPGVGPKMAYLTMSAAWGRDEGIGVDVHVHRITNLWGWHKTQQPEQTRAALESWLPREKWHDINNLLVGFGQTICLPVGRKCGECSLATNGLCPSAVVVKSKKAKKKEAMIEVETSDEEVVVKREADDTEAADDEVVVKREQVDAESEVKVKEVEKTMRDIEDFGRSVGTRTMRRRA